ncbi:ABC transporter ATP-binding protein [Arthrobacter sp. AZCC_0090]|uniref:ABC transporter ATP-binding protein n=1 Tax=Arthrobacter sp. AZCC_0090 TaxID=2735881 RepID=UPI001619B1BA|nr:ABC transporter ATP-binding protein [Arthrobacter sp. AZCC_0090]MBB6405674.1 ATP-binding cassette subfamily B protein [Arthrobacter sp. AZCC_0090]
MVSAWVLKRLLEDVSTRQFDEHIVTAAVTLAVLGLALALLTGAARFAEAELSRKIGLGAQDRLHTALAERLRGLSRLEDPAFQDRLRIAQIAGRTGPIQVTTGTVAISKCAITFAGFVLTLFMINVWLLLAVILSAVPAIYAEVGLSKRRDRAIWKIGQSERRQMFYASLLTAPSAAKELRLLGLGKYFRKRMLSEMRSANAVDRAIDARSFSAQTGLSFLSACVAGVGLVWAVNAVREGKLSIGDISVLIAAVAGIQSSVASAIQQAGLLNRANLSMAHYAALTTLETDIIVPASPREIPPLAHSITLENVWFRYGHGLPWVLKDANLTIYAGETTALVGLNGAGKSTVIKLLCRLYEPIRGRVLWDGIDVRSFDPEALRNRISAVFQDYMQYELSLGENIGLGDVEAITDGPRIHRAAALAGIQELVRSLPDGLETMITRIFTNSDDRANPGTGVVLSGGQGQRVAMARAFMRENHDLLILDEPSAGLDAIAEKEIHERLRTLRTDKTTILISHRMNAVRDANRIVVLDRGDISESGSHENLMEIGGRYAELFNLQSEGFQRDSKPRMPFFP